MNFRVVIFISKSVYKILSDGELNAAWNSEKNSRCHNVLCDIGPPYLYYATQH